MKESVINVGIETYTIDETIHSEQYTYDDIESRVCENCKYYKIYQDDDEGYCSQLENWYTPTFGCNLFELESK